VLRKDGVATLAKGRLDILDRQALEDVAGWDGPRTVDSLAPRSAMV
jgi:hypothetical protein